MPSNPSGRHSSESLSDADLAQLHLDGHDQAFGELCTRYRPKLVAVLAARYHNLALAEDIAQDALLRAMERLNTYDSSQPFWPWLRTVAINIATDRFRREQRVSLRADPQPACALDPSDAVNERRIVGEALLELPERQRHALVLTYVEGWPAEQAAARMNITRNAFDQLLHRARGRLRLAYLAIEPETTRRTRMLIWPVIVAWLRRVRTRAAVTAEAASAQLVPAAFVLPVLAASATIAGGFVVEGTAPERASVAFHQDAAANESAPVPPRDARPPSTSLKAERNVHEQRTSDAQAGALTQRGPRSSGDAAEPQAVTTTTETTRERNRLHQRVTIRTGPGDSTTGRESDVACDDDLGRATCDMEEAVATSTEAVLEQLPAEDDG